ncbi:MAG: hypothetical protein AAGM22_26945 [Acidobacteriota bacterium]
MAPAQATAPEQQVFAQPPAAAPQDAVTQQWTPPAPVTASTGIEVMPPTVATPPPPEVQAADIYAPPTAVVGGGGAFPGAAVGRFGSITEDMVVTLENSSRWISHTSRFGYFLAVMYVLLAIAGLGGTAFSAEAEADGAVLFGMFIGYGLMAAIMFMVAHHLRGAARSAKMIREAGNPSMAMADTLQHQSYFWKVTGCVSLVSLVMLFISLLFILGAALTGVVAG